MATLVEIENIEEMRRQAGIDDAELRREMRTLKAGDIVKITLLNGSKLFETVAVRITSIRDCTIRGKLVQKPTSTGLAQLQAGTLLLFTTAQIHSIPKMRLGSVSPA